MASSVVLLLAVPQIGLAQAVGGRIVEAASDRGVPGAIVRLMDPDGEIEALSLSDSAGRYSIDAPSSGEYRLTTEAYGYEPFRSPLLALGEQLFYGIDLEVTRAPVPIRGISVAAHRFAELEDGLRLVIGIHPRSLRYAPILRPEIEKHIERAHGVAGLVRWSNLPSIVTRTTTDGPCFQWRNRRCLPVYLNGAPIASEMVPVLPLDMVEMVVIMAPGESLAYGGGGVLLFTPGWIG